MAWRDWILPALLRVRQKQSAVTRAVVLLQGPGPVWTPRDYASLAREGYEYNAAVYACVNEIARSVAGIPWLVRRKARRGRDEVLPDHPLARLIRRPNPWQGQAAFFEAVAGFLMLAGNSYVERVGPERGLPRELYPLRPDRVAVIPDAKNLIGGYRYSVGGVTQDFLNGEVLHLKLWHPTHDWYGLSPIEAAARQVDKENAADAWNLALLQHAAAPSGALATEANLTDEQFQRLERQLEQKFQGARNAGRPLILEGGLEWQRISLTPEEMAWLDGQKLASRKIASIFGVPPELIGDSEAKTYANYQEARKAFYQETILPLMDRLRDELNNWLTPLFGDDLELDYDRDNIEALHEDRERVWRRTIDAAKAGLLTVNEARAELGLPPIDGGDVILVPANMMPLEALIGAGDGEA